MDNSKAKLDRIMELALSVEGQYDVSAWKLNEVHLWPLIKHVAYFDYKKDKPNRSKLLSKILDRIFIRFKVYFARLNNKNVSDLEQADILFCGANPYFVNWKEKNYNKFFDPIIKNIETSSIQINYSLFNLTNILNLSPTYNINQLKFRDRHEIDTNALAANLNALLKSDVTLIKIFEEITLILNTSVTEFQQYVCNKLYSVLLWKSRWSEVIEQVNPRAGIVLCYYDMCMYGLVLALRDKGVPSTDIQHGGQGVGHPAYSYAEDLKYDLNLLPDFFWIWDETSQLNIERWTKSISPKPILGGNPWIRYFTEEKVTEPVFPNRKFILCTLPADKSYYNLMPDALLDALKKSNSEYIYGFRFHPKTTSYGKKKFRKLIEENKLMSKVDMNLSNSLPLPYLFATAWGHISVGSIGSIAEAAIIGVQRNVILDGIGRQYYQKLIDENKAFYFDKDADADLLSLLEKIEIKNTKTRQNTYPIYTHLVNNIMSNA